MPLPDWLKEPPIFEMEEEAKVKSPPLFWTERGPFPVTVDSELLIVKPEPTRLMPAAVLVLRKPLKVDMPLPDNCEIDPAWIALAVILFAASKVMLVNGDVPPTLSPKRVLPVPLLKARVLAPSIVLEKVIDPAPEPELTVVAFVKVIALPKEMAVLTAVKVPSK